MLVNVTARIACMQLVSNRHVHFENPVCSDLFILEAYGDLLRSGQVVQVNVPQRALGFNVYGEPGYNNISLWASNRLLFLFFMGVGYMCKCHG